MQIREVRLGDFCDQLASLEADRQAARVKAFVFGLTVITLMHGREWEILTRANGLLAAQFTVTGEVAGVWEDFPAKPVHELREGIELAAAGVGLLEIANEADADGRQVDAVALYVAAEQLFRPARADLDFAVAGVDAVTDQKVIGHAVLHAAAAVCGIVFFEVSVFEAAVVGHDALPVVGSYIDVCAFLAHLRQKVLGGGASTGDLQDLADANHVCAKIICLFDAGYAHPVLKSERSKGISGDHCVGRGLPFIGGIRCAGDGQALADADQLAVEVVRLTDRGNALSVLNGDTSERIPAFHEMRHPGLFPEERNGSNDLACTDKQCSLRELAAVQFHVKLSDKSLQFLCPV